MVVSGLGKGVVMTLSICSDMSDSGVSGYLRYFVRDRVKGVPRVNKLSDKYGGLNIKPSPGLWHNVPEHTSSSMVAG